MDEIWTTSGFEAFRRGKFGNGGQNIYVSRAGVLQRIHRTSVRDRGHVDLMFANAQAHEEMVPLDVYPDPVDHPERKWQIHMAAASDGVVADFSGKGHDDMAWSFVWDGMSYIHNSAMYYMTEEGPSDKYITYLPAPRSSTVAAGDFDGDGRADIIYGSGDHLRLFLQDRLGFNGQKWTDIKMEKPVSLLAHHFPGDKCATLFLRKKDGSVTMLKEFGPEAQELPVLPKDPDYAEVTFSWDSYNQAVEKSRPKLREITLGGKSYLTVFRNRQLELYPFGERQLGTDPLVVPCREGLVAETADLFGRGQMDLIVAARDRQGNHEYSYVFLGKDGFLDTEHPLAIPTYMASDVCVGKLSGGKGTDFVISQNHTYDSFDNDILVFPTGRMDKPGLPQPVRLTGHNVYRSLIVRDPSGRSYLVVGNQQSGSYIGNPENTIYLGSDSGYHQHDVIHLPSWGSVALVCADLNDDGRADLVFANAAEISGAVYREKGSYVYYQKPDGTFGREPFCLKTRRSHGVVAGDFNHNGYLDLAFCGFDNSILKVFYGGPDGYQEENAVEIELEENGVRYKNPLYIGMADLNGDGYLDLILPCTDQDVSMVLWGGPDGFSMKNKQLFRVHRAAGWAVADLNGDGYPELIWGSDRTSIDRPWDSFVTIYWGGPNGFSETRRTQLPSCSACRINVADFNRDGLLDLFVNSYEGIYDRDVPSYIYWNSPEGFSPYNRTCLQTHAASGSVAADFDDDGYIDLAVGNHKAFGMHICNSTVWHNGPEGFSEKNTTQLPTFGVHGMLSVDAGNILDRSFDEFYESEFHPIPEGCGVSEIWWDADVPHKCDVFAQFRTADTPEALEQEPWRGPTALNDRFRAHDDVETERFCGKFMQYRLILYSFNSVSSPRVRSVSVKFKPCDYR